MVVIRDEGESEAGLLRGSRELDQFLRAMLLARQRVADLRHPHSSLFSYPYRGTRERPLLNYELDGEVCWHLQKGITSSATKRERRESYGGTSAPVVSRDLVRRRLRTEGSLVHRDSCVDFMVHRFCGARSRTTLVSLVTALRWSKRARWDPRLLGRDDTVKAVCARQGCTKAVTRDVAFETWIPNEPSATYHLFLCDLHYKTIGEVAQQPGNGISVRLIKAATKGSRPAARAASHSAGSP